MKLTDLGLRDARAYAAASIALPRYDRQAMRAATQAAPVWVHFGAGNIFRGFIASLQQTLLNEGLARCGVIAAETFDFDIITRIYQPHDALALAVTLQPDGGTRCEAVASIAAGLCASPAQEAHWAQLCAAFANPSLQMASFTITEKGYALRGLDGAYLPAVQADLAEGPAHARHAMSVAAALLYARYRAGAAPIAMVSMDNCSHNGEKLRRSVTEIVRGWEQGGFVDAGFAAYVEDEARVSFPWSMIDKITPRPAQAIEEKLTALGLEDMQPIVTSRGTYIAPFVNAEEPQYLVVEDRFPNGRPQLEAAGVYMTDRDTVNLTERMKVTTCLNPLHTALAVYGCLLGYESIAAEMQDEQLTALVRRIGYDEGLPVVTDPVILSPRAFIDEVVTRRLPNPFIPDTPQRIATDTSQKVAIRFGETIKSYVSRPDLDPAQLVGVPLALAGWLRYLLAVDDTGAPMAVSADPMLEQLQSALAGVRLGRPDSAGECLRPILSSAALFGTNLYQAGLGETVERMFARMTAGPGAVRETLRSLL